MYTIERMEDLCLDATYKKKKIRNHIKEKVKVNKATKKKNGK